jgi:hypothetical protein
MDRKYRPGSQGTAARTCVLVLTLTGMMTLGAAAAWAGEPTPTTQSQLTGTSQQQDSTETSQQQDSTETSQQQDPTETSQQQDPTETSQQQDPNPPSIPVTVSPRAGSPGTTVTVRADLRGCTRAGSAQGFFLDRLAYGVDGASRRLVREHVAGGRWYSGQYLVTNRDAVGQGEFGVACDFNLPTATEGHATFRVRPSRAPVPVRVTPQAAGRGTTVKLTAEVGRCERIHIWFYDSKSDGLTQAGGAKPVTAQRVTPAGSFTASYTLTRKDAIGPARFRVVCGLDIDNARVGEASFRVLAANGQGPGGGDQTNRHDNLQLPNRIDTGQGGTADGAGQGGLDPTRLLLPAGLLLIVVGAGLGLRHSVRSRR